MSSEDQSLKKYKVFLPRTDFSMKADLPTKEPKRVQRWHDDGTYKKVESQKKINNETQKGKGRKILHDGPPYANGAIHIGHALNKILKDIVVKSSWLDGYESPYVLGWDCHGLPIEHAVEKELGSKRRELSSAEFISLCRAYAQKWISSQMKGFQRLGVIGSFEAPYITMDPVYEAQTVRNLAKLFEVGLVTRKLKVVHWSYGARTALAEAEIEYENHETRAVYVAFPLDKTSLKTIVPSAEYHAAIAWTTTPWTLPSNRALTVHPRMEYLFLTIESKAFLVAKTLADQVNKDLFEGKAILGDPFLGITLEGQKAKHPWLIRDVPFLMGDHVTSEAGTGIVHTAPDHGVDDFLVAQHLGLFSYVGPDGKFTSEVPDQDLIGINVFKSNDLIIEKLLAKNMLLKVDKLVHSYPHCWRTKTPIIFRATEQWFIPMDTIPTNADASLRIQGLKAIQTTIWVPQDGQTRIYSMVDKRPDWCISRQRSWGTPITVLKHKITSEPYVHPLIFERAAKVIEKEGVEAWSKIQIEDLCLDLPINSNDYIKETDILDVWMDSGISASVITTTHPELEASDMGQFIYFEGSDQHRGWFHSSLLFNLAVSKRAPYHTVVTHGFVLDGQGQKMSKSLGNVITPDTVLAKYGADIIRWWAATSDYQQDVRISNEIMDRSADSYRKIRNTIRFILGSLDGFDPKRDYIHISERSSLDQWIISRASKTSQEVIQSYRGFDFINVARTLLNFCQIELSNRYFEIIKDTLYCDSIDDPKRRGYQSSLYDLSKLLIKCFAPIVPFTAEEAWEHIPSSAAHASVFQDEFEELLVTGNVPFEFWDTFWEFKSQVHAALEPYRAQKLIGTSLDAHILINPALVRMAEASKITNSLSDLLVCSEIGMLDNQAQFKIEVHSGSKCPRCWKRHKPLEVYSSEPLCNRCTQVDNAV